MPTHTYSNWNRRESDEIEQKEPYRKYYFICEGANTETFYFRKLIDLRKQLNIHPMIDICLLEKTGADKDISYPKLLADFAEKQKRELGDAFDSERDKMIIVFDGDIFEDRVDGYDELINEIESKPENLAGITNPAFELFLLLHIDGSYEDCIKGHEAEFFNGQKGKQSYAYVILHDKTNINAKRNEKIGELAADVVVAIDQEKNLNQDIYDIKGKVTSNLGKIIEGILEDGNR